MNRNHDNLTPAQKAKYTRLYNKLNDQRCASFRIQYDAYRAKSDVLYPIAEKQAEEIKAEAQLKIEELQKQIAQIEREKAETLAPIYEAVRKECAPEWEAYLKASDLAREWHLNKWEEAKENFWQELEA
jgi:hypothetical protein